MGEFLVHLVGFFIIFYAIDYGRTPECVIKGGSKEWLITLIMVLVASLLIQYNG